MARILFVTQGMVMRGGIEVSLLRQIPELEKLGYEPHVLVFEPGVAEDDFKKSTIPYTIDQGDRKEAVLRKIEDFAPDIISAHQPYCVDLVEPLRGKIPLLGVVHSRILDWASPEEVRKFARSLAKADALLAIGEKTQKELKSIGVENSEAAFDGVVPPQEYHATPRISPEDPRLLFIGRPDYRKGLDVLLRAMPLVLQTFPKANLRIVGNDGKTRQCGGQGPDGPLALELGLDDHIDWLGQIKQSKVYEEMQEADLMIVASRFESFSNVSAEAQSMALPIVGTATVYEVMAGGLNGILTPPDNPFLLASAIVSDLHDTSRVERGLKAESWTEESFSLQAAVDTRDRIYKELLAKS